MIRSLRARLVVATAATAAVLLAAVGATVYSLMRTSITEDFDAVLGSKARVLSMMVVDSDGWFKLVYERSQFPEYEAGADEYFQIWRPSGQLLARSPSLGQAHLPRAHGTMRSPLCLPLVLPDGQPGRIAGIEFIPRRDDGGEPDQDKRMTLAVSMPSAELDGRLARLRWLLGGVCAVAVPLVAAVLAGVVSSLMRPLRMLALRIEQVDAADISERFAAGPLPHELEVVAQRLDDLLHRLQAARQREKAFTADVAHELRTPIAGLRAIAEVILARSRDSVHYREALEECGDIGRRMQILVDDLLSLAQLESGRSVPAKELVQIDYLVRDLLKPHAARVGERAIVVQLDCPAPVFAESDEAKLRIVVSNLIDNAVSYVDHGGSIRITCTSDDGRCRLEVSNSGCALMSEEVDRVFDRFWRGDPARASSARHCGLGLSLCQRIVAILGGTLQADVADGRFIIVLSIATAPGADDDQPDLVERSVSAGTA